MDEPIAASLFQLERNRTIRGLLRTTIPGGEFLGRLRHHRSIGAVGLNSAVSNPHRDRTGVPEVRLNRLLGLGGGIGPYFPEGPDVPSVVGVSVSVNDSVDCFTLRLLIASPSVRWTGYHRGEVVGGHVPSCQLVHDFRAFRFYPVGRTARDVHPEKPAALCVENRAARVPLRKGV